MDDADAWSASTLSVREALRESIDVDPQTAVVATVSGVEGSAYRRPGAKRVLDGDDAVGAITAGCLEGPVADLAEQALADGPLRETFDLTGEDDAWEFGLGCNGVIDVLVEPADGSFRHALDRVAAGERVALLTVVGGDHPDAAVGARGLVDAEGDVNVEDDAKSADARPSIPDDVLDAVRGDARRFAEAGQSDTVAVETDRGTAEVFVDGLEPAPELLAFGHGADVRPVARLARDAGFRVTVATARGGRADAEQFPAAHEVVATRPPDVAEAVTRPDDTYAVVMSHNFVDDRLALEALLDCEAQSASDQSSGGTPRETGIPYVGLMGPRKRFDAMREEFAAEGTRLSDDDRERVSTPVGLDLGGGEPFQIALSVVGEVLAVANGRDGGRLTRAEGPIHPRSELDSAPAEDSDSS